ncbi:MAG: 30S ribosomal protein S3 [Deltaproteobacteria bacterium]|nr:30S ribosomal protein S3 [Deltaproteobacteria bacterium]
MGQKVHPYGFRLGVTRTWSSIWFSERNYARWLHEDLHLKRRIKQELFNAGVAAVEVKRTPSRIDVVVHTSRPGFAIGKKGERIDELKKQLKAFTDKEVYIDIQEVRKAETNAQLVAENVATQLERRVAFRRAMKKALFTSMRFGALGFRIQVSGRLGGAEMSRQEKYREGRVPLHTLRANIEYGFAQARTTYGVIGVKTWIYLGDVVPKKVRRAVTR